MDRSLCIDLEVLLLILEDMLSQNIGETALKSLRNIDMMCADLFTSNTL